MISRHFRHSIVVVAAVILAPILRIHHLFVDSQQVARCCHLALRHRLLSLLHKQTARCVGESLLRRTWNVDGRLFFYPVLIFFVLVNCRLLRVRRNLLMFHGCNSAW